MDYRKQQSHPLLLVLWLPAMAVWASLLAIGIALAHLGALPGLSEELREVLAGIRWTP
jgi:hypothetical protein